MPKLPTFPQYRTKDQVHADFIREARKRTAGDNVPPPPTFRVTLYADADPKAMVKVFQRLKAAGVPLERVGSGVTP